MQKASQYQRNPPPRIVIDNAVFLWSLTASVFATGLVPHIH